MNGTVIQTQPTILPGLTHRADLSFPQSSPFQKSMVTQLTVTEKRKVVLHLPLEKSNSSQRLEGRLNQRANSFSS